MSGLKSISLKMTLGYSAILIFSLLTALPLISSSQNAEQKLTIFVEQTLPDLANLRELAEHIKQAELNAYLLYGYSINIEQFREAQADLNKNMQRVSREVSMDDKKLMLELEQFKKQLQQIENLLADKDNIDWDKAREQLATLTQSSNQLNTELKKHTTDLSAAASQRSSDIVDDMSRSTWLISLLLLCIVIISGLAYLFSRRTISSPIQRLAGDIQSMAANRDLTRPINIESQDEIGQTATQLNEFVATFRRGLNDVASAVEHISQTVTQLEHTSDTNNQTVITLNQQISEILTVMKTLEQQIVLSCQRSVDASEAASSGAKQVSHGAIEVEKTAKGIAQLAKNIELTADKLVSLKSAGDSISGVVSTIAAIAEQTNLLALNAAIEAARAGESGRGFAVVADEVRTLATRTHNSTTEINSMLAEIIQLITDAVSTMEANQQEARNSVDQAGVTVDKLSEIQQAIMHISNSTSELADISNIAGQEVQQVSSAIGQFEKLGNDVTLSSEANGNSATELVNQAAKLNQLLKSYQL
ncbi:methyl-accepting chemotaxis protein [Neptunicella marina]|uniref:Methyl-accepting chemotaxis protein n=1 Tax=Neptunicella marina TaxID=2125989 RepID=A0A8J6M2I5_9ALTE|nr:methyl-accepting chemotaxis protein [Neptunicella marina]